MAYSNSTNSNANFRYGTETLNVGVPKHRHPVDITQQFGLLKIGNNCINNGKQQKYVGNFCNKLKSCGHLCLGVKNESECLPCLHGSCQFNVNSTAIKFKNPKLTQDINDICVICFETLDFAPSIQIKCGHVLHYDCCKTVLEKRWVGSRITFGFSLCTICRADIDHALLAKILEPIEALKQDVKRKASTRMQYEGSINFTQNTSVEKAMERYAYYMCFKCKKPYYGGEASCDDEIGEFKPADLVCGECSNVGRAQMCPIHGSEFLGYKCQYCCSLALYYCYGSIHFCKVCHDFGNRQIGLKCPVGPRGIQLSCNQKCPLNVVHPPTGEKFVLGCGACLNLQTF